MRITFGCQGKADFTLINLPFYTHTHTYVYTYILLLEDKEVRVTKYSPRVLQNKYLYSITHVVIEQSDEIPISK